MFIHGKTGKKYYSVREKLNYFKTRISDKSLSEAQRKYAKTRISELSSINERTYNEPRLVVTDDKVFGNQIHKPRLCAVIDEDKSGKLFVAPIVGRTTKAIILDNDHNRQVGDRRAWIDRSNIYEDKYIEDTKPLTTNDKIKIKNILRKK
ncbi:MAG: hypothetical protein NC037_00290 [Bacteroides sp.]|nr:hypothetical protein [Bacillota bacterium]MCM1393743.1 hypothetical protein [[Eubacterium] siraeum]MCM1454956.1 hypothetical protein [Bacteroides sp.]